MAHIINSHDWVLPTKVIESASLEATKKKLTSIYLSDKAKSNDDDFLFYKDEENTQPAFVIDKRDL